MIVPDINLLLHAYDSDSPFHEKVSAWWEECLSGTEPVGLPSVVVCGFLRISTNARGFKNPMTPAEASQQVRSWLAQPGVPLLEPRAELIEPVRQSLVKLGPAGNLVTAAQSAALAGGHEATRDTNDTDFMRFSGERWCNPLTDSARAKRRKTCNPGRTTAPSARLPGAGIFAASAHRDLAKVRLSAMRSAGRAGRRRPRRRGTLPLPVGLPLRLKLTERHFFQRLIHPS